ncbi:MAG: hypothetical protein LBH48_05695 [Bifidobacteriaceae bacterium]|jgi:hypothetical protein|nr:hypothetical protein [Bifidobacteriaceae bacterium]
MTHPILRYGLAVVLTGALASWGTVQAACASSPAVQASGTSTQAASDPCDDVYTGGWQDWTQAGPQAAPVAGDDFWKAFSILGDRFVDLWSELDPDGNSRHLVVGVWNLKPSEVSSVEARLHQGGVAAVVKALPYSRAQVNALAGQVIEAMKQAGGWSSFGARHFIGAVEVVYRPECVAAAAVAIEAATGKAPLQGAEAAAFEQAAFAHIANGDQFTPPLEPIVVLTGGVVEPAHMELAIAPPSAPPAPPVPPTGSGTVGLTTVDKQARAKVKAKVSAKPTKKKITRGTKARVKVSVKVPKGAKAVGKVIVSWGEKSKTVNLKASAKGKVTVKLPRLKAGKYRLTAQFVDQAGQVAPAWSKGANLTVVK